jgi:SAM-dependent methyltransferase
MKETDIRPKDIFEEYLKLAEEDTKTYFSDVGREKILCPACGCDGKFSFSKSGFAYDECQNCLSLYVSPRPPASAFSRYYLESQSSRYWATTFYRETAEARKVQIWRPKARLISESMEKHSAENHSIVDIGGGYGLFAVEMKKLAKGDVVVVEPAGHLAEKCREASLEVVEKFLEEIETCDLPSGPKFYVSFELFEHLHDPLDFLQSLSRIMGMNDYFIFTTLSGTGLDIRVLWEKSKAVSPPHHLNFFNPVAIDMLLEKAGFRCLEVTTPGKLDINILENNIDLVEDRFWKVFLKFAPEEVKEQWQSLITDTCQSSHMMVTCQKL